MAKDKKEYTDGTIGGSRSGLTMPGVMSKKEIQAYDLRRQKKTFKEIAGVMKCSRAAAYYYFQHAKQRLWEEEEIRLARKKISRDWRKATITALALPLPIDESLEMMRIRTLGDLFDQGRYEVVMHISPTHFKTFGRRIISIIEKKLADAGIKERWV